MTTGQSAKHNMNSDCKILLVTNMWPSAANPGFGSFVKEQAESLHALGVEYDVLFINGRESRWNYLRSVGGLRRSLQNSKYTLVHAHFGLSGCVARLQTRTPLVVTFHGDDVLGRFKKNGRIALMGRFFQISSFVLARRAEAVIVQSQEMKRKLRLSRAEVIPCGVNLNLFHPLEQAEARRALGLSAEKKYVLFPYDPAVEGKCFPLAEAAVRRAALEIHGLEMLRVLGRPHAEMPFYMNAADALILTSFSEGSPVAVKEAMAVNLPVVTVDVGDAAELIGQTRGCYVVPRDAEAIAVKIVQACGSGARTHGRDAIARLSMENIARRIVDVYARVLENT
ncbi:MAG: glycosyltransferase [Terriglobia bacterium]